MFALHAGTIALVSYLIVLAAYLIYSSNRSAAVRVAGGTLVVFSVYVLYAYFSGVPDCGCAAGEQVFKQRDTKYLFSITRNLFLLGLLVFYEWDKLHRIFTKAAPTSKHRIYTP